MIEMFRFLLVMRDKPTFAYFLTVHTYKLLLRKIMQTQPCRKYLLGNNGYNIPAVPHSEGGVVPRSSLSGVGLLGFWEFGMGGIIG